MIGQLEVVEGKGMAAVHRRLSIKPRKGEIRFWTELATLYPLLDAPIDVWAFVGATENIKTATIPIVVAFKKTHDFPAIIIF